MANRDQYGGTTDPHVPLSAWRHTIERNGPSNL